MSLLGVDIGSSSCKAAVFSARGKTLAVASRAYATVSPGPSMTEIDAEEFWRAAAGAIRETAAAVSADPVEALCIGSHGETFIPVDGAGAPVGRAVMNSDSRATEEAVRLGRTIGRERLYGVTGAIAHPMYPAAKIMWLQRHRRDLVTSARRFLGPAEYVLSKMGLPPVSDYSLASRWGAFDIMARRWSDEILSAAGMSAGALPETAPAGTLVGRLSAAKARELGLAAGVVVALGGHDQPCSTLGAGAVSPGVVSDSAGTYECLACTSEAPSLGPAALNASLNSYCHVVPQAYVTLAFFPSGILMKWFVDRIAAAEAARSGAADPHSWFEARLPEGPTGVCITPHLIGACNPHWNPRATTAMIGLTPATDLFHMYKGIVEGIACEFALNAGALQDATGPFSRVRITGGGAASGLGLRLRASLPGRTLETLRNPDAVCLGAAIIAGVTAGTYRNVREGAAQAVEVAEVHPPEPGLALSYAAQAARYNLLYPALAPLFGGS